MSQRKSLVDNHRFNSTGTKESPQKTIFTNTTSCSSKETTIINVNSYLHKIKQELASFSHPKKIRFTITNKHKKTMFRTLLGIHAKKDLDARMKKARCNARHIRIARFLRDELSPFVNNDNKLLMSRELLLESAPRFYTEMEILIGSGNATILPTSKKYDKARVEHVCSSMATGRKYRGVFSDLLSDVAPELLPRYLKMCEPMREKEVMMEMLLEEDYSYLGIERLKAVEKCVHFDARTLSTESSLGNKTMNTANVISGKKTGLECECACIDYLAERLGQSDNMGDTTTILQNVFVMSESAARKNRMQQQQKRQKNFKMSHNGMDNAGSKIQVETGTITTSTDLEMTCCEFDAIVIVDKKGEHSDQDMFSLTEIWEAKVTLSPTTIYDATRKKHASIKALLADDGTTLLSYANDKTTKTRRSNGEESFLFGIFGMELLPVDQAVNQLKTVVCCNALANDVNVVMEALQNGIVQVGADKAIAIVDHMLICVDEVENLLVVVNDCQPK